ncbi:MAG: hypothetical protein ACFB0D_11395 [Phormidesmis sp.]
MGANSRVSMAYVAACVTLTCTAATMTTANLSHQHTAAALLYEVSSTPFSILSTQDAASPQNKQLNRFFARAHRFHRNNNKLANGGLHV